MNRESLNIYWGDAHHNLYVFSDGDRVDMERVCREARRHLDFLPLAYYTPLSVPFRPENNPPGKAGIRLESWKDPRRIEKEWAEIQEASKAFNDDGSFVTFPGYEWQGDGTSGDHNVICRREGASVCRAARIADLYGSLRGQDAYAIPHHTAYRAGHRGRDWSVCDEALSPFSEIYSLHGCSETDEEWIGLRSNPRMGPALGGGTYQDALDRGLHLGAICSGDNFGAAVLSGRYGNGLMACLAPELTRRSLWESFGDRRVYGVTGDRIELDFSVNGRPMGSLIESGRSRRIRVQVVGQDAIDRIEILRNGRVLATHCHQGTWSAPRPGRVSRFKLRFEAGWGPSYDRIEVPDRHWRGEMELSDGRFTGTSPAGSARASPVPNCAAERVRSKWCRRAGTCSRGGRMRTSLSWRRIPARVSPSD